MYIYIYTSPIYISTFKTQPNIISVISSLHLSESYLLPPKVHQAFCAHLHDNSVVSYNSDSPTSLKTALRWDTGISWLRVPWHVIALFLASPWICTILLLQHCMSLPARLYHLLFLWSLFLSLHFFIIFKFYMLSSYFVRSLLVLSIT